MKPHLLDRRVLVEVNDSIVHGGADPAGEVELLTEVASRLQRLQRAARIHPGALGGVEPGGVADIPAPGRGTGKQLVTPTVGRDQW